MPRSIRCHTLLRPVRACLVLAATLSPMAAQAHASLVDSAPGPGGHERSGHVAFRLRFNSRIDAARSRVTLTQPDQAKAVLPITAGQTPDVLQGEADLGPGAYSLRWQVLAIDGHITRGDVAFTLDPVTSASAH